MSSGVFPIAEECFGYMVEKIEQLLLRFRTQQQCAFRGSGNTLEERRRGEMTADVQNAAILVDAVDALAYLPTQYVELRRIGKSKYFPFSRYWRTSLNIHGAPIAPLPIMMPSTPKRSKPPPHLPATFICLHCRLQESPCGVILQLPDQRPVRLSGIHLRACASVHRQRLYAAVLQSLITPDQ